MENILITGGAGYIGSHTCKLIASHGYNPICLDNLSTGYKEFVKWGPLIESDIRDTDHLVNIIKINKPIAVIHFAACAYISESVLKPLKYYDNNISGTISLLNAMKTTNLKKIVFSSSCATYGIPKTNPIKEDCPQLPINPYGETKLVTEKILDTLAKHKQISHVSLRYFNAAGADKDGEIGEKHVPETHLIPLAIESSRGGKVLEIYGTDYKTKDGTAIRDYIHVEDLAEAHYLSLKHLLNNKRSEFINLGSGNGYSVKEIITELNKLNINVKFKVEKQRVGDPSILIADCSKAKKILKWEPGYKKLNEILSTAINWHLK